MVLRKVVTPCSHSDSCHRSAQNAVISDSSNEKQPEEQPVKQPQDFLPVPNPMPSYWLKQPHHYAQLRTTKALPSSCDIAIIGSGMAGILTVDHILQTSHLAHLTTGTPMPRVVILDARDLCSGATARNGGHSKVKTATLAGLKDGSARTAFQTYVHRTHTELKSIVDEEKLSEECEFELRRSFDVFQDKREFDEVKKVYDEDARKGEGWTRKTSVVPGQWVERVTSVKGAVGAFSVEAASFWPYKFVTGLLEVMVKRYDGVLLNVQMNTVVTRLSTSSTTDINQLETPRGTLTAGKVILATNAYTASLLHSFSKTIIPYKGMNSHHTPSPSCSHTILPHLANTYNIHFAPISPTHPTGCDYLNPRPDGSIVVGGGSWFYQNKHSNSGQDPYKWLDTVDDSEESGHFPPSVYAHWTNYMANTFLGWGEKKGGKVRVEPDSIWTGIQGHTWDGMPHVGRVPSSSPPSTLAVPYLPGSIVDDENRQKKQQWLLAGFNGGGMALIPLVAKAVAKMVLQDIEFEDVREEFGLLEGMGTGGCRMTDVEGMGMG